MSQNRLKVAFDIGGVLTKHPRMILLMETLQLGWAELFVITDMPAERALHRLTENNIIPRLIEKDHLICVNWSEYQDNAKALACRSHHIDILIDDQLAYLTPGDYIGLLVVPRPNEEYNHPSWKDTLTPVGGFKKFE